MFHERFVRWAIPPTFPGAIHYEVQRYEKNMDYTKKLGGKVIDFYILQAK